MKMDITDMEKQLSSLEGRLDVAIKIFADQGGKKLKSYAQQHAPWTDRSGRARGGLNTHTERTESGYRIVIAYDVDYGIWLELANEKKYSILPQSINYVGGNEIMPAWRGFMEKLRV